MVTSVLIAKNISLCWVGAIAHLMVLDEEVTVLVFPMATIHLLLQALNWRLRLSLLLILMLSCQKIATIFTRLPWTISDIIHLVKVILSEHSATHYFTIAPKHLGSRIVPHVVHNWKLLLLILIWLEVQLIDDQLSTVLLLLLLLLNLLLQSVQVLAF